MKKRRVKKNVVDEMKEALGLRFDAELARHFGLTRNAVLFWRKANKIPNHRKIT